MFLHVLVIEGAKDFFNFVDWQQMDLFKTPLVGDFSSTIKKLYESAATFDIIISFYFKSKQTVAKVKQGFEHFKAKSKRKCHYNFIYVGHSPSTSGG